jgi:2-dehydropantoate 2-reductase
MNIVVIGTGGVGAYYGAKLLGGGNRVLFVARGKHLEAIKEHGLQIIHPDFSFHETVEVSELTKITQHPFPTIDAILLTTKSDATQEVAQTLQRLFNENIPYIISLQNGVENEKLLLEYLPKERVIGGLSRKLGAFIKAYGVIEGTGRPETIVGSLFTTDENQQFLLKLKDSFEASGLFFEISDNIQKELWIKLVINNGVNALCALLKEKTGVVMHDDALSFLVYKLMEETARAAMSERIDISKDQVDAMHNLITNFDSIKPSMQVDVESGRKIELDEICGVVIRGCEALGDDAPYTRTIATLLDFTYNKQQDQQ